MNEKRLHNGSKRKKRSEREIWNEWKLPTSIFERSSKKRRENEHLGDMKRPKRAPDCNKIIRKSTLSQSSGTLRIAQYQQDAMHLIWCKSFGIMSSQMTELRQGSSAIATWMIYRKSFRLVYLERMYSLFTSSTTNRRCRSSHHARFGSNGTGLVDWYQQNVEEGRACESKSVESSNAVTKSRLQKTCVYEYTGIVLIELNHSKLQLRIKNHSMLMIRISVWFIKNHSRLTIRISVWFTSKVHTYRIQENMSNTCKQGKLDVLHKHHKIWKRILV